MNDELHNSNRQSSLVNRQSKSWWREALEEKREASLHRALRVLPRDILDLASNDYLGLSRHPDVVQASCQAAQNFGAGARASRLVSGHFAIHQQLETELAGWKNCQAALIFPSGYHANLAVVTSLARPRDLVCCDKRNHASLIDACLLAQARGAIVRFYDSLPKLRALLLRSTADSKLIVSDAVYSMDGDLAPVPELTQLATEFDATLILDDAHGTGTLGQNGRGTLEYFEERKATIENQKSIVQVGTFSKALGSQGGFVVGEKVLIDWLVNAARSFIYTTGLNPAACGAALRSIQVTQSDKERLLRLQRVKEKLARGLSALGYELRQQPSPILPILIGEAKDAVELSEKLLDCGVWCPAIRPPTVPQHSSRLRITAHADLTDDDIARVLSAFAICKS